MLKLLKCERQQIWHLTLQSGSPNQPLTWTRMSIRTPKAAVVENENAAALATWQPDLPSETPNAETWHLREIEIQPMRLICHCFLSWFLKMILQWPWNTNLNTNFQKDILKRSQTSTLPPDRRSFAKFGALHSSLTTNRTPRLVVGSIGVAPNNHRSSRLV